MQDQPRRHVPNDRGADAIEAATDWFLRLREDDGPATTEAFRLWREADPSHARAFTEIAAMWNAPELSIASQPVPTAVTPARQGRRRWPAVVAMAAMLALALVQGPRIWVRMQSDYLTDAGESIRQTLPDGSTVTLNTATAIATDFSGGIRQVRLLRGEAFFDVAPDAAHPFVVETRFGRVRVTGTQFSVRLDEDAALVVLREGHVRVEDADGAQRADLLPGEMVQILAEGLTPVRQGDVPDRLAWLDGRIEIHDQPLAMAMAELGRYRGGRVTLLAPGAGDIPVSGIFTTSDPEAAIRTLAGAAGLRVRQAPGGYVFLY